HFLGARVNGGVANLCLPRPEGNQSPSQQRKLARSRIAVGPHHRLYALRRRVVAGAEPRQILRIDAKPVGEDHLGGPACKATTHPALRIACRRAQAIAAPSSRADASSWRGRPFATT